MLPCIEQQCCICYEDILVHMNVSIAKVPGQCFDGASNMKGSKNGVAKQIEDAEPRALYTHCYRVIL